MTKNHLIDRICKKHGFTKFYTTQKGSFKCRECAIAKRKERRKREDVIAYDREYSKKYIQKKYEENPALKVEHRKKSKECAAKNALLKSQNFSLFCETNKEKIQNIFDAYEIPTRELFIKNAWKKDKSKDKSKTIELLVERCRAHKITKLNLKYIWKSYSYAYHEFLSIKKLEKTPEVKKEMFSRSREQGRKIALEEIIKFDSRVKI